MRKMLYVFFILLSLQSCSVYHSRTVSLEEAVEAQNRVKVTTENISYKFRKLQLEDGQLMGVAHQKSNTARKVSGLPLESKGKDVYVYLSESDIKELRLRNDSLSVLVIILIPLFAISLPILILAAAGPGMPGYP